MKLKAVLFDLDGTLLPMEQNVFVHTYLQALAAKLAPWGFDPKAVIRGIWAGTDAMVKNRGEIPNREAFWAGCCRVLGDKLREQENLIEEFYRNEFQNVRHVCGFHPGAAEVVRMLKAMGIRRILATNPLFPSIATHSRVRWAGLEPEDFEWISTYENSRYSKPNPDYYRELLKQAGLEPEECLMVGNDVAEDMIARTLGLDVFLLTDCIINPDNRDISAYPRGSFPELAAYLKTLTENE